MHFQTIEESLHHNHLSRRLSCCSRTTFVPYGAITLPVTRDRVLDWPLRERSASPVRRSAAEDPFLTTAESAAAPLLPNVAAREPDAPGQSAFANDRRVSTTLEGSGWAEIDIRPIDVACTLPKGAGPLSDPAQSRRRILQETDDRTRAQVIETVRTAWLQIPQASRCRSACKDTMRLLQKTVARLRPIGASRDQRPLPRCPSAAARNPIPSSRGRAWRPLHPPLRCCLGPPRLPCRYLHGSPTADRGRCQHPVLATPAAS